MTGTLYNLKSGQISVADASDTTADTNDLNQIDGLTAGTVAASKAVVVGASADITGFRNVTATGTVQAATVTATGTANAVAFASTTNAGTLATGTFASAGVGGTILSASRTAAVRHYADDGNSAIAAGNAVRTTVNRFLVLATNTGDVTISAAQNQVKIATATPGSTSPVQGAWNYLEVAAAATIPGQYCASKSHVDCGSNNVTVTGVMAAVGAFCKFNGTITETGPVAAVYIDKDPAGSTNTWPQAIYVNSASAVFKFPTGTAYEAGVKVGAMSSIGGGTNTSSGALKIFVGSTAYYIPFYAAGELSGE